MNISQSLGQTHFSPIICLILTPSEDLMYITWNQNENNSIIMAYVESTCFGSIPFFIYVKYVYDVYWFIVFKIDFKQTIGPWSI